MISPEQLPELRSFAFAEKSLQLRSDPRLAALVVPNGNWSAPCHRWFKYKEAFSCHLVGHVVSNLGLDYGAHRAIRMLDPFCGVGTSLLSAQLFERNIESIGIECNPFAAFVARTKVAWHQMDANKIRKLAETLLAEAPRGAVELPALSSIKSGRCITQHMARQIMLYRRALESLPPSVERDALTLGLASIIEPVSRIRRDGRALRIVEKPRILLKTALADRWRMIASDVESMQNAYSRPAPTDVRNGDGREPATASVADDSIDLILTSPPYPNNIDYNEVYKLELWFLGYAKQADEFLALRRETFRSHPTCRPLPCSGTPLDAQFRDIVTDGPLAELMGSVIRRVEVLEKAHRRGRTKVLMGYIHDTWRSLQAHFRVLRSGGRAVYVVGNSLHGAAEMPYLVPTDLIFTLLGKQVGFELEELNIARGLKRRLIGNHFLRDSVVVFRKN